ncbi:response regulator transcription factor [Aliifodinibius sp. 1BSP15-2V2]|uniref:Response regulator transcription factor n=2 Tax=Fodinibius salsisoli TaxID=2820877 RepID=A0ABT3PS01_9BACT|nr:response regulator transcription factor [Fodinibius salsisoli]
MHINLLNHNNIEGKGLSVLLGNEGHNVNLIPQQKKRMDGLSSQKTPSIFLINVDFLLETKSNEIFTKLDSQSTVLLFGNLCQLYWLKKFSNSAKGFICKKSTFNDLLDILHDIKPRSVVLDRHSQHFLSQSDIQRQKMLLKKNLAKSLSNAELSVMQEISEGKPTKQIAKEQYLSVHTIYNHRKNIKKKFNPTDTLKLSKFCMLNKEAIKTLVWVNEGNIS